jgi:hypothetical protein
MNENVDGTPGTLNIGDPSNPVRYTNVADLFAKASPRLYASVLLPGTPMPGLTPTDIYEIRKGIYETYPGIVHTASNSTATWNGMRISGKCGIGDQLATENGFTVWKYCTPTGTGGYWTSYLDWIESRYAEVLLNKAEAAVNILGETVNGHLITMADALAPINDIRDRAGLKPLTTVDEAAVIKETRCELAFENLIIWDMKRWRMFESVVQNQTFSSLYPYYVWNENKYIFIKSPRIDIKYTWKAISYYAPISATNIAKNPALLPNNPGY